MSRPRQSPRDSRNGAPASGDQTRGGQNKGGGSLPWLYGHHPVAAALANPNRRLKRLVGTPEGLNELAIPHKLQPEVTDKSQLDQILPAGAVHQGVALLADPLPEYDILDIVEQAAERATVIVLDHVTDPHNVGAILRSAAVFGACGLVMTDRHAPASSGVLAKAASGALESVPIARVVNLARALKELQEANFWCVGLDAEGARDLSAVLGGKTPVRRTALVLGAEGEGLRRLTAETCDELAKLPAAGAFTSLNVSNAAAVALYVASRRFGD